MLGLLNSLQTLDLHARGLDDPIKALSPVCWSENLVAVVLKFLAFSIKIFSCPTRAHRSLIRQSSTTKIVVKES